LSFFKAKTDGLHFTCGRPIDGKAELSWIWSSGT